MDEEKKGMYRYSIILIIFALIIVYIIQSGVLEETYRYIMNMFTKQTDSSFKTVKFIFRNIIISS